MPTAQAEHYMVGIAGVSAVAVAFFAAHPRHVVVAEGVCL